MSENAVEIVANLLRFLPGPPPEGVTVEAIYRTGDTIRKLDAAALATAVVEALTAAGLLLPGPAEVERQPAEMCDVVWSDDRRLYVCRRCDNSYAHDGSWPCERGPWESRRCTPWQREL